MVRTVGIWELLNMMIWRKRRISPFISIRPGGVSDEIRDEIKGSR
jgi:hypothetical protein